jgi:type VI secretion system protein ImpK
MTDPARVSTEGRADSEPLVPNDTDVNRARNRRVEVTLLLAPAAASAPAAAAPAAPPTQPARPKK